MRLTETSQILMQEVVRYQQIHKQQQNGGLILEEYSEYTTSLFSTGLEITSGVRIWGNNVKVYSPASITDTCTHLILRQKTKSDCYEKKRTKCQSV